MPTWPFDLDETLARLADLEVHQAIRVSSQSFGGFNFLSVKFYQLFLAEKIFLFLDFRFLLDYSLCY